MLPLGSMQLITNETKSAVPLKARPNGEFDKFLDTARQDFDTGQGQEPRLQREKLSDVNPVESSIESPIHVPGRGVRESAPESDNQPEIEIEVIQPEAREVEIGMLPDSLVSPPDKEVAPPPSTWEKWAKAFADNPVSTDELSPSSDMAPTGQALPPLNQIAHPSGEVKAELVQPPLLDQSDLNFVRNSESTEAVEVDLHAATAEQNNLPEVFRLAMGSSGNGTPTGNQTVSPQDPPRTQSPVGSPPDPADQQSQPMDRSSMGAAVQFSELKAAATPEKPGLIMVPISEEGSSIGIGENKHEARQTPLPLFETPSGFTEAETSRSVKSESVSEGQMVNSHAQLRQSTASSQASPDPEGERFQAVKLQKSVEPENGDEASGSEVLATAAVSGNHELKRPHGDNFQPSNERLELSAQPSRDPMAGYLKEHLQPESGDAASQQSTDERATKQQPFHHEQPHASKGLVSEVFQEPSVQTVSQQLGRQLLENNVPVAQTDSGSPAVSQTAHQAAPEGAASVRQIADAWSQVEKASVISQLVEKARLLAGKDQSELVVSLKPEFLGRINLRAALVGNSLVATIMAESSAVKNLLESQLSVLQESFQREGLPVTRIEVMQGSVLNFSDMSSGHTHPRRNFGSRQVHGKADVEKIRHQESNDPETPAIPWLTPLHSRSIHLIA